MIVIKKNPKNQAYKDLIDLAIDTCDVFQFVLRKDMGPLKKLDSILKAFESSLIEMKVESEWASTILGDNQVAEVYYYHADENTRILLKSLSNSLFEWVHPNLPEDLSFFKLGKEWLVTSSHEGEAYLLAADNAEINKIKNIRGLETEYIKV